jgi:hypothetical protein
MTTDMRYGIAIDAAQANTELQRIRTEVTTLAGQENALAKATDTATTALTKQGAAAAATSPKVETFQQRVAKLPDLLGKQAAAVSLVSSSLEGMGGQIGKAIAAAGQFSAAYGAGGIYAAALVAAVGVGDLFVKHLHEVEAAQDAAFTKNFEARYGNVLKATERIRALKDEVVALERAIDPENTAQGDLADLQEQAIALRKASRDAWNASYSPSATKSMIDASRESARLLEIEATAVQKKVDVMLKAQERQAQIADNATERTAKSAARASESRSVNVGEIVQTPSIFAQGAKMLEERRTAEANAAIETVRIEAERQNLLDIEVQRGIDYRARAEEASRAASILADDYAFEQRKAATEQFNNKVIEITQQSASIIAGASSQLIADLIGHQEHALERFGISIMAQAGQSLISNGVQLIGEATKSALTGNLPLAAIQGAGAAGLITAGVGLGGAAAGLSSLMGAESGGAARGASPRTSTGGSGAQAGPTQVTYIFAPSRDEGAAAVALAGKNAERRGLMNNRTR